MSHFYCFVSRDVLTSNDKHVLTYRKFIEPGWLGKLFGRRPKTTNVKFIGNGTNWRHYPSGKKCSIDEIDMLRRDDQLPYRRTRRW